MSSAVGVLILISYREAIFVACLQPRGDLVQVTLVEAPIQIRRRLLERRDAEVQRLEPDLDVRPGIARSNRRLVGEHGFTVSQPLEAGLGQCADAPITSP